MKIRYFFGKLMNKLSNLILNKLNPKKTSYNICDER